MTNPFSTRSSSLSGPATDIIPVTPDDTDDLSTVAIGLYVEAGGAITFEPVEGAERTVNVSDFAILPVGVRRVRATGTTAGGIHALVLT